VVRTLLRLVFLVVLALVLLGAWVGVRGWLAKDHLETSADLVQRLQLQVERGNTVSAQRTLRDLQGNTDSAVRLTGDMVWRGAGHLPFVGDDLKAVHAVAVTGQTVSSQALPPLVAATADISSLRSASSLTPAQAVAAARRLKTPLATAKTGVDEARTQIHAVDQSGLVGPVRTGVRELAERLDQLGGELTSLVGADDAALKAVGAAGA
jgi:Tfp pilus assembly protein FimT